MKNVGKYHSIKQYNTIARTMLIQQHNYNIIQCVHYIAAAGYSSHQLKVNIRYVSPRVRIPLLLESHHEAVHLYFDNLSLPMATEMFVLL